MTLLPGLLVLVAGCGAQLFPANTQALTQPQLHVIPVLPYYQPLFQPLPQVYTNVNVDSGIIRAK